MPSFEIYKYSTFGNVAYIKRYITYAFIAPFFLEDLQPVLKPSGLEPYDSWVKEEHIPVLLAGMVTQLENLYQT